MNVDSIFDGFNKASEKVHAMSEINRIKIENIESSRTCGSCQYWMTQQCGRERCGHKVQCSEFKCQNFLMNPITLGIIQGKENKIKELQKTIS